MLPRSQLVLLGSLAAILVISLNSSHIDESYLRIAMLAGVNITLAVSLNLINGYTGQFSLGHAGFMSVGAYTSAAVTLYLGPAFLGFAGVHTASTGLFFLLSLLAGGVLAGVAGFIVGAPSLRLKGDYLAIVTLGFGEIIRVIFTNVKSLGGGLGLNGIPPYTNFFWTYGFAAVTVYVVIAMVHSTYGRGFLAVHDDEVAAEAMGINTTRYKITAFVTGSFFAGVAGGIFAHLNHSIHPSGFDFMKSIEIVVMVILGGMGNTTGVVLAAILLTVLPEFLRSIDQYRMVIYSLLLIVLMLTRPQGLFTFRKGVKVGGLTIRMTAAANMPPALLQLENCTIRFGGLTAVSALNLQINEHDLIGLIGPNGAGKTTIFNLITGVYQPTEGNISFGGKSIVGRKPYQITEHGIARTFQNIRLFPSLSVFDNVRVAFHLHLAHGVTHALLRGPAFRKEEDTIGKEVMEMLEIFRLTKFRDEPAKSLPYGDQRRLEIVRALATRPKLLLLDEPAAGMNPTEKVELMKLIQFVKDKYKIAVLLVEHDMQVVMGMCQRIAVLDYGVKIAEGTPAEVRKNPKVIEAYLGEEPAHA